MTGYIFGVLLAVLLSQKGLAQEFKCPNSAGYFPDPEQCDLYYECRNGAAKQKLCKDGLVFNDKNPLYERCGYPFTVTCGSREYLQTPQPSKNCPRKNGLFANDKSRGCKSFWQCTDGTASKINCQTGLAFNPAAGTCQWKYLVPQCE